MSYSYFMDESGNTGDLISKKMSTSFGGQPIFALACVGIQDLASAEEFVSQIKIDHGVESPELKSEELYFQHPGVMLDVVKYIHDKRMPVLVEVVDKRYTIATAIVGHQILPPYDMRSEDASGLQRIRNYLADFLTFHMTPECFKAFSVSCMEPSQINLLRSIKTLRSFFEEVEFENSDYVITRLDNTVLKYFECKKEMGEAAALGLFVPIPDKRNSGGAITLLPHIHSKYNILGRLNKYHLRDLKEVSIFHDKQNEFDGALKECISILKKFRPAENMPEIGTTDFCLLQEPGLSFVESEDSVGVQFADVLAGFVNRYVNGFAYKDAEISDTYHQIFKYVVSYNRPMSPLGVNFVLPPSKQFKIFKEFHL